MKLNLFKNNVDDFENARHDFTRSYTFIIAPNSYGKTRKFTISAFWLKNWVLLMTAFVASFVILLISYIGLAANYAKSKVDLATLQAINKEQQMQLYDMSELSTELENKLVYLDLLQTKIQTLLDDAISSTDTHLSEDEKLLMAEIDTKLNEMKEAQNKTAIGGSANNNYYVSTANIKAFDATIEVSAIKKQLEGIEASLNAEGDEYQVLNETVETIELYSRIPEANPLQGQKYSISSYFGYRTFPSPEFHKGVDLSCASGTPIKPAARGIVIYSGWRGSYGNCVIIDHQNGYQTLYAHMRATNCKVGQDVNRGTIIGFVGTTGYSTGNHLHFEVIVNGVRQNPMNFVDF
ncbi:MAG: M23 family metallopeptidase [Eubacteriaceae bacterium]|nr:M23 family metallopeptidase [Eubacteriaceae bacterium]